MDIDFDGFDNDFKNFRKIWNEAHKKNDKPRMTAILNAMVSNLESSSEVLRDMSRLMNKSVVADIQEEVRKK